MADDAYRYRSTLDHLLEGFQLIGRDWKYLYVNPAAAAHGRKTPEELVGRTMAEAFPGIEATPLFEVLQTCLRDGVPAALENRFAYEDGSERWFELRVEPVPEGLCVHSIDIEERKQAEQRLHRLNEELEQRVADRTREIEEVNRELEAFSYAVSHDLRGPLRAIDGFATALHEDFGDRLDEEGKGHLARVRAAAQRMGGLIDSLLSLARMGRATLRRETVDLSALAREVASELERSDPSRTVAFRIAPDLRARCDAALVRVVFDNLLGNAWKFTARTPDAVVEVLEDPEHPGTFVVSDNGAGFDMRYSAKLFVPFQRLHDQRDFAGTGIGLATVQRIVRKHGGTVELVGAAGKGAVARFSLAPSEAEGA